MSRIARGLPGIVVFAAGCGSHYDEPSTSTYVIGAIFILLGLALAYGLITGRK